MTAGIDEARRLLATPPGPRGSGRVRYGAAMTLNRAGLLSHEALEVYRICALLDREDPAAVMRARGVAPAAEGQGGTDGPDGPGGPGTVPPQDAIAALIAEADLYLAGLTGPGIAEVRAGIAAARGAPPRPAAAAPAPASAPSAAAIRDRWLGPALAALAPDFPALAAAIAAAAPHLGWITYDSYPRERIGAAFADGHAFASVIGEAAPVAAADFDFGLFLIAPGLFYRDRRHPAPELYAPLTGPHGWRFRPGAPLIDRPAHRPVWNDPLRPHATLAGPLPFLCLFAWTRDVNAPAEVLDAPDWAALEGAGAAR